MRTLRIDRGLGCLQLAQGSSRPETFGEYRRLDEFVVYMKEDGLSRRILYRIPAHVMLAMMADTIACGPLLVHYDETMEGDVFLVDGRLFLSLDVAKVSTVGKPRVKSRRAPSRLGSTGLHLEETIRLDCFERPVCFLVRTRLPVYDRCIRDIRNAVERIATLSSSGSTLDCETLLDETARLRDRILELMILKDGISSLKNERIIQRIRQENGNEMEWHTKVLAARRRRGPGRQGGSKQVPAGAATSSDKGGCS